MKSKKKQRSGEKLQELTTYKNFKTIIMNEGKVYIAIKNETGAVK